MKCPTDIHLCHLWCEGHFAILSFVWLFEPAHFNGVWHGHYISIVLADRDITFQQNNDTLRMWLCSWIPPMPFCIRLFTTWCITFSTLRTFHYPLHEEMKKKEPLRFKCTTTLQSGILHLVSGIQDWKLNMISVLTSNTTYKSNN